MQVKFECTIILLTFLTINNNNIRSSAAPTTDLNKTVIIQQVPYGDTVTLLCRSNDENHNFLYWYVTEKNTVVGPGNKFDDIKFNYEVLSGNLTIKAVTKAEEGLYNCVSRGVKTEHYNIRSVRMLVQKDWEEVYEDDPEVNAFRIIIVILTLMAIAGFSYYAYKIWRDRYRNPSYLVPSDDEDDEESAEEIFRTPGPSRQGTGNIVINKSTESFESPGISTDFKSILDNANNK